MNYAPRARRGRAGQERGRAVANPRGMRRLIGALILLAGGAAIMPAAAIPVPPPIDIVANNCLELVPHAVHVPVVDPDDEVFLDVYLVGDRGVTKAQAEQVLADAQESYAPLNITLRKAGWKAVSLSGTDSQGIINQTKALFPGNVRPDGSDIVWTLTTVDLTAPGVGNAVAGQADCLGGVRYARNAFMVAEWSGSDGFGLSPIWFYGNMDAKIASHETGHLMGAQHHYADCAEGVTSETGLDRVEVSPCTVMTNFADFISINFSTHAGAVVRGHAEEWARP